MREMAPCVRTNTRVPIKRTQGIGVESSTHCNVYRNIPRGSRGPGPRGAHVGPKWVSRQDRHVGHVLEAQSGTWVTRRIATCATSHEAHKRQVGQLLRWQIATWATREKLGNPRGRGGKLPREKRHFGASHVGPGGSGGMAQVRVSPTCYCPLLKIRIGI